MVYFVQVSYRLRQFVDDENQILFIKLQLSAPNLSLWPTRPPCILGHIPQAGPYNSHTPNSLFLDVQTGARSKIYSYLR